MLAIDVERFLTAMKAEQTVQEGYVLYLLVFAINVVCSVQASIKTLYQIAKFESLTTIILIYIVFILALNIGEN